MRFTNKRKIGPEIALESVPPGYIIILNYVPYIVTDKVLVCATAKGYNSIECCNLETGHCKLFDGDVKVRKMCFAKYVNYEY